MIIIKTNKIKIIFLMISLLIGLPPAYTEVNASIIPDYINDGSEFSVDIYFVGTSFLEKDELLPVSNDPLPVYEHFTDFLALTQLTIKVNVSGYTHWDFTNKTYPNFLNSSLSTTIGQIFVILNNDITTVYDAELDELGISINVPLGDHTLSVLYIGKDENAGIVYASDALMIRNFPKGTELPPLKFDAIQASIFHDELFTDGEIIANITSWYNNDDYGYSYDRRVFLEPEVDFNLFFNNGTEKGISEGDGLFVKKESTAEIVIRVKTNSTGVDGLQILHRWNKTQGISFLYDTTGIRPIDTDSLTIKNGNNYIGVITFSPYGMWHANITDDEGVSSTGSPNGKFDWEIINQPSTNVTFHSSFDFLGNIDGVRFLALLNVETQTLTSTNENTTGLTLITALWILVYKISRRQKRL